MLTTYMLRGREETEGGGWARAIGVRTEPWEQLLG